MSTDRSPTLLAWQWSGYPTYHARRANLVIHCVTQPIFVMGFFSLVGAPFTLLSGSIAAGLGSALGGLAAMAGAMIAQGRGHRMEASPPIPFSGAGDVIGRILLEQLVNFPRFVLTGGLARAWRRAP